MAPDRRTRQLAMEWVRAADRHLELARAAAERRMGNETVSLAAAAVERYFKATLAAANQAFEYTHNIDRLLGTLDQDVRGAVCASRPGLIDRVKTESPSPPLFRGPTMPGCLGFARTFPA